MVVNICIFKKSPLLFSSVLHNTNYKQGKVPMLKVISIKIPWAFQGRRRNQPQLIVLGSAQLTWKASRGTSNFSVNYPGSHPLTVPSHKQSNRCPLHRKEGLVIVCLEKLVMDY